MPSPSIGILGVASYLPPEIRVNDWWAPGIASQWTQRHPQTIQSLQSIHSGSTSDLRTRVHGHLAANRANPFLGIRSRHVMPKEMCAADMEYHAAVAAMESAEIPRGEVDLVICGSAVPDRLIANSACVLHDRLAFGAKCFTLSVDVACNTFLTSLDIACQMIATKRAHHALIVQSCAISRLLDYSKPHSVWWGDGATAAVVGPVSPGRGVLSTVHRTDGSLNGAIVAGVRNREWYEEGHLTLLSPDPDASVRIFIELFETGRAVVNDALRDAASNHADIDYFAVHQALSWVPMLAKECFGLKGARTVDTFSSTGNVFGSTVPLGLIAGERESLLRPDDLVLMFGMGAGATFSATVLRWGK